MLLEEKTRALIEELRKRGFVIIPLHVAVSILVTCYRESGDKDLEKLKSAADATQEEIRK